MTISTFYRQRFRKTQYSKLKTVYFLLPLSIFKSYVSTFIIGSAHEIMVLITQVTNEFSGEPAHSLSLDRAFAVRTHEV